jgi:hypothetical protein
MSSIRGASIGVRIPRLRQGPTQRVARQGEVTMGGRKQSAGAGDRDGDLLRDELNCAQMSGALAQLFACRMKTLRIGKVIHRTCYSSALPFVIRFIDFWNKVDRYAPSLTGILRISERSQSANQGEIGRELDSSCGAVTRRRRRAAILQPSLASFAIPNIDCAREPSSCSC